MLSSDKYDEDFFRMTARKSDTKPVRTTVILSRETDEALRALARREQRPVTWEIRRAIEKHIEDEKAAA